MKPYKYLILLITWVLFIITLTLPFVGVNLLTDSITSLGFFDKCMIIHNGLSWAIFIGGAVILIFNKKIYSILYVICLIMFIFGSFTIFEWIMLWILCIYISIEIIKDGFEAQIEEQRSCKPTVEGAIPSKTLEKGGIVNKEVWERIKDGFN